VRGAYDQGIMAYEGIDLGRTARCGALGLVQGYNTAPVAGYWPSEGVLPPDLRPATSDKG